MPRPLTLKFTLINSDISTAKRIKDYLYQDIPVMAIDYMIVNDINISGNEDVLFNELGFLAIDSSEAFRLVDTDKCESVIQEGKLSPQCSVIYTLDQSNDNDEIKIITTSDFKTSNPLFPFIKNNNTEQVILKLAKGQYIKIICVARRGYGITHAKWIPVSKVVYDYDRSWGYDYKAFRLARQKDNNVPISDFRILADKYNFRIESIGQYDANQLLDLIKVKFPQAELENIVIE